MCRLRDCSVCECPESEFPEVFKKPLSQYNPVCQEGKPQATVDRTLDTRAFRGWTVTDNPWTSDDETDNGNFSLQSTSFLILTCRNSIATSYITGS
jgi:ERO1-like protein alpha